jgi:hypothetical protein
MNVGLFLGQAARQRAALALVLAGLLLTQGCLAPGVPTCPKNVAVQCTRVLFLGNSYTYVNDLPTTFARLAASGGKQIEVGSVSNGGETLAEHDASADSVAKIKSAAWSYVVLQEQSQTPSTSSGEDLMFPAARDLAAKIEAIGAVPMFFMTWAHRDGWPEAGMPNYESMQKSIDAAYLKIADELKVPVAPVGYTWYIVRHDHPDISLWIDDGSHPTSAGTYLAACVFYASIFRQSPNGLSYHGDISNDLARTLQDEASRHVLDLQDQWGIR